MPSFADKLKRFDRKERNWLLRDALGNPLLSDQYRTRLQDVLGVSTPGISIPSSAFWAIDFHWNWLIGALAELAGPGRVHENDGAVKLNQEDIDLLVAYENTAILIEAKATGSWDNDQIESKLGRLGHLRNAATRLGTEFGVSLHFVLTSPARPKALRKDHVWHTPDGQFIWMELLKPDAGGFLYVTMCDGAGKSRRGGSHWTVR